MLSGISLEDTHQADIQQPEAQTQSAARHNRQRDSAPLGYYLKQ